MRSNSGCCLHRRGSRLHKPDDPAAICTHDQRGPYVTVRSESTDGVGADGLRLVAFFCTHRIIMVACPSLQIWVYMERESLSHHPWVSRRSGYHQGCYEGKHRLPNAPPDQNSDFTGNFGGADTSNMRSIKHAQKKMTPIKVAIVETKNQRKTPKKSCEKTYSPSRCPLASRHRWLGPATPAYRCRSASAASMTTAGANWPSVNR